MFTIDVCAAKQENSCAGYNQRLPDTKTSGADARKGITFMRYQSVIVIAVIFLSLTGCFRAVLVSTTAIEKSNEDDIVVSTKEGRQISFDSRQYNLDTDEHGQRVLRGKGKAFRQGEPQFKLFEGTIPIDDIKSISRPEKTSMFYVTIVAATLAVGYVLFWTLALNGRGFGG